MRPAGRDVRAKPVLERVLLLVYLHLVAMKVPQHVNHAIVELVFLDLEAPLVYFCLAELTQLDFGGRPIGQQVVRLVQQIIDAVEVSLDCDLHLVTLDDLLARALQLVIGFVNQYAMVLNQLRLLLNCAIPLRAVDWGRGARLWLLLNIIAIVVVVIVVIGGGCRLG